MRGLDEKAVAAVLAARKARAPKTAEHKRDFAELQQQGWGGKGWREEVQTQLGIARHPVSYGDWSMVANGSVRKCIEGSNDELDQAAWVAVSAASVQAFYDGYALGSVMFGGAPGTGRVFTAGQQLARWETNAFAGARALVAAMGPSLDALVAAPGIPAGWAEAPKLALAMGLLLHQYEFEWKHAWLDAAAGAKSKRRAEKKAEPQPVHLAPNEKLLQAIIAAPDDDGPRKVYADWLTERGDPRGEFILLQCALGRTLSGAQARYRGTTGKKEAEVKALKEREVELIKRHEKHWLPEERCFRTWAWRRGFLSSVLAEVAPFAKGVGSLALVPLESAKLGGFKPKDHAAVMAAPGHPTLRFITMSTNRLDAKTMKVLGAKLFSRVRGLDLWGNLFGEPAAAAELAKLELPGLERLALNQTELTDEGLRQLAQAPFFSRLTHLDLRANRAITVGGLEVLSGAKSLKWVAIGGTAAVAKDRARLQALLPKGAAIKLTADDPVVLLDHFV